MDHHTSKMQYQHCDARVGEAPKLHVLSQSVDECLNGSSHVECRWISTVKALCANIVANYKTIGNHLERSMTSSGRDARIVSEANGCRNVLHRKCHSVQVHQTAMNRGGDERSQGSRCSGGYKQQARGPNGRATAPFVCPLVSTQIAHLLA